VTSRICSTNSPPPKKTYVRTESCFFASCASDALRPVRAPHSRFPPTNMPLSVSSVWRSPEWLTFVLNSSPPLSDMRERVGVRLPPQLLSEGGCMRSWSIVPEAHQDGGQGSVVGARARVVSQLGTVCSDLQVEDPDIVLIRSVVSLVGEETPCCTVYARKSVSDESLIASLEEEFPTQQSDPPPSPSSEGSKHEEPSSPQSKSSTSPPQERTQAHSSASSSKRVLWADSVSDDEDFAIPLAWSTSVSSAPDPPTPTASAQEPSRRGVGEWRGDRDEGDSSVPETPHTTLFVVGGAIRRMEGVLTPPCLLSMIATTEWPLCGAKGGVVRIATEKVGADVGDTGRRARVVVDDSFLVDVSSYRLDATGAHYQMTKLPPPRPPPPPRWVGARWSKAVATENVPLREGSSREGTSTPAEGGGGEWRRRQQQGVSAVGGRGATMRSRLGRGAPR
jgi:hypothetical protein